MINETAKTNNYRYIINLEVLLPDKTPIKIDTVNIGSVYIEKDYDNAFFPVMCVNVFFETNIYYTIMKNRTTVRFKMKMEKYIVTGPETGNTIKYKELVFNDIFNSYITDNEPNINKDLIERTENDGTDSVPYKGVEYELYLFKDTDMKSSKKIINTVIERGTMSDTVAYLLSKSGTKKVLMAPLQNNTIYDEILLLPTTVIQNMVYLEKQYGFYNNGMTFFYDFDCTYLIPKASNTSAYRGGEYLSTVLTYYKSDSTISSTPGSFKDKDKKMYIIHISRDNIYFKSNGILDEQISGATFSFVDPSNDETTSVTPDVENRNTQNTKTIINNLSNKMLPPMIANQKHENDNMITALIYDFDLDAITPNKKIVMSFEDSEIQKKYGGNYRISYARLILNKQGEEFDLNAEITIKKPL